MAKNDKSIKSGRKPLVDEADAIIKDKICREIFLNFTVDEEKVLSYQLKPHFAEMLKHRQSTTSRDGALTLEHLQPLVDSILDNWNPATFAPEILNPSSANYPQIYIF